MCAAVLLGSTLMVSAQTGKKAAPVKQNPTSKVGYTKHDEEMIAKKKAAAAARSNRTGGDLPLVDRSKTATNVHSGKHASKN